MTGALGSLALLGAAGALVTAMALASHVHQFSAIYGLLKPGAIGAGLLFVVQLAYLPNAVIWAIAYMLGPGFAVGAGTVVAPSGSVIGQLPAFPMLAALPLGTHGQGPAWLAAAVLAIPYLAGALGGLLVARMGPADPLESTVLRGFCSGALTGAVLGLLAAFAGGPLGAGRLSAVGPSAWQVAAVAGLEIGISAAVSAGAASWLYTRAYRARRAGPLAESAGGPGRVRPQPTVRQRYVGADDANAHVIYVNTWQADQKAEHASPHARGPSALPDDLSPGPTTGR